ncbi:MAG: hypothetical protein U9R36_04610, partial [Elusimicrobiota bacterium]|nr:hypothetical protein [Elusimicrobiota bacterium]
MSFKLRKTVSPENLIKIFWLFFFTFLVFFIDVKLARYKLIGVQLSLIALMFLWFFRDYRAIGEIIKEAPFLPPLLLVLFYSGAYLFSPAAAGAYPEWQRVIFSIAAYIAAYRIFYPAGAHFLVNYVIAAGGLISIYGLLQVTGGIGFIGVPRLGRIFATFGNPNFFASFLIGLLPLAVSSFLTKKRLWKLAAV